MAEDFRHHWGQVYEPCNPDQGKHLIIDSIDRATGTAKVSFPGGRGGRDRNRRRRTIKLSSLHPTGTTETGAQRRSGYRLMAGPPKDGEDMCEMCYHYFNRADLNSGCCQPCAQWLAEAFPRPLLRTTHA